MSVRIYAMYLWQSRSADWVLTGMVAISACGQLNRENKFSLLTVREFALDNLVSRDEFGSRVPRRPAHSPNPG